MKIFLVILNFIILSNSLFAREIGETEITAEEGIEVFQDEKYYLLKKNVKIESDNFTLIGDTVKIENQDLVRHILIQTSEIRSEKQAIELIDEIL